MNFPMLSVTDGIWLLLFYATMIWGIITLTRNYFSPTKNSFLVADRSLGLVKGSMSIGAAWTWAPGIFVAAFQGYTNGITGLFWFSFGNILSLMLFGYFAAKIRERNPDGFTLSSYLGEKYGKRVQGLVGSGLYTMAIFAATVNILAGSQSLEFITGINYHYTTVAIALLALSYALCGGMKASVVTEIFKISVFYIVWATLAYFTIDSAGGAHLILDGIGGKTGQGTDIIFSSFASGVIMTFGLPVMLGHFSSPWADSSFYQRAYAIEKKDIWKSFIFGALLFSIVPIASGTIGLAAAGLHLDIPKSQALYTVLVMMGTYLPEWTILLAVFVLIASLTSIIDTQISNASTYIGNDLCNKFNKQEDSVKWTRTGMIITVLLVLAVANFPGMTFFNLWLIYGVARAAFWMPVMLGVINEKYSSERGIFYGIIFSWMLGLPIYIWGQAFNGGPLVTIIGTLLTVFGSGLICLILSRKNKNVVL